MTWGDKGEAYRPDLCDHDPDDGCEWCCRQCNVDQHLCPGCGTVANHKEEPCDEKCAEKERQRETARLNLIANYEIGRTVHGSGTTRSGEAGSPEDQVQVR